MNLSQRCWKRTCPKLRALNILVCPFGFELFLRSELSVFLVCTIYCTIFFLCSHYIACLGSTTKVYHWKRFLQPRPEHSMRFVHHLHFILQRGASGNQNPRCYMVIYVPLFSVFCPPFPSVPVARCIGIHGSLHQSLCSVSWSDTANKSLLILICCVRHSGQPRDKAVHGGAE